MGEVRIGVVGCGRIARAFHLPALTASSLTRVLAVADPDPDARAAATALAPGAAAVASVDELLAQRGLEAVVVCAPTPAHAPAGVAALEAGLPVYVEKPLALSSADAAPLVDAWRRTGQLGAVGFAFRFHPLVRTARALLEAGELGQLVGVRTTLRSSPRDLPAWKRDRSTGGGALLDLASHHLDLVRVLTGREVVAVSAGLRSVRTAEDTAAVQLRLDGGLLAQILVSSSAPQADEVELIGDRATVLLDRMGRRRLVRTDAAPPTTPAQRLSAAWRAVTEGASATWDRLRPPAEPSFALALDAFAAAARGEVWEGATITDGARALAVVEAAERAAADGRERDVASP